MSLLGSAVITGSLAITNGNQIFDNPQEAALQHLGRAAYIELDLSQYVQNIEKKYISKRFKTYAPYVIIVGRIATERQVSYTWRF
jgi:hypothetical protein